MSRQDDAARSFVQAPRFAQNGFSGQAGHVRTSGATRCDAAPSARGASTAGRGGEKAGSGLKANSGQALRLPAVAQGRQGKQENLVLTSGWDKVKMV